MPSNKLPRGTYMIWHWKTKRDYHPGQHRGCLVRTLDAGPDDYGVLLLCPYHSPKTKYAHNNVFVVYEGELVPCA